MRTQLAREAEESHKRAEVAIAKKDELWAEARKVGNQADDEAASALHKIQGRQQVSGRAAAQTKEE